MTDPLILEKSKEQILINDDDISADSISTELLKRENGIDHCILTANDDAGRYYLTSLQIGDPIIVKYYYEDAPSYNTPETAITFFKGYVMILEPVMTTQGQQVKVTCFGKGYWLKEMRVAAKYGILLGDFTFNPTEAGSDKNSIGNICVFDDTVIPASGYWEFSGNPPFLDWSGGGWIRAAVGVGHPIPSPNYCGVFKFNIPKQDSNYLLTSCTINLRAELADLAITSATIKPKYRIEGIDGPNDWHNFTGIPTWTFNTDSFVTKSISIINDIDTYDKLSNIRIRLEIVSFVGSGWTNFYMDWMYITAESIGNTITGLSIRDILYGCQYNTGMISDYVDHILKDGINDNGTLLSSGFPVLNIDYVYGYADDVKLGVMRFPYEDALICLQDLIKYDNAARTLTILSNRTVNSYIEIENGGWTFHGNSPYLGSIDENYIENECGTELIDRSDPEGGIPNGNALLVDSWFIEGEGLTWDKLGDAPYLDDYGGGDENLIFKAARGGEEAINVDLLPNSFQPDHIDWTLVGALTRTEALRTDDGDTSGIKMLNSLGSEGKYDQYWTMDDLDPLYESINLTYAAIRIKCKGNDNPLNTGAAQIDVYIDIGDGNGFVKRGYIWSDTSGYEDRSIALPTSWTLAQINYMRLKLVYADCTYVADSYFRITYVRIHLEGTGTITGNVGEYKDTWSFEDPLVDPKYTSFEPDTGSNAHPHCRLRIYAKLYDGTGGHATSIWIGLRLWVAHLGSYITIGAAEVVSTSYQIAEFAVGDTLTTLADWNSAKLKIDINSITGGGSDKGGIKITYAPLSCKGTAYWGLDERIAKFGYEDLLSWAPTITGCQFYISGRTVAGNDLDIEIECQLSRDGTNWYQAGLFEFLKTENTWTSKSIDIWHDPFNTWTPSDWNNAVLRIRLSAFGGTGSGTLQITESHLAFTPMFTYDNGVHWIIDTDGNLLLAPVGIGNHHVEGASGKWIDNIWADEWIRSIVVRQDMISESFKTEIPVANLVLVAGKYQYPMNNIWCQRITDWIFDKYWFPDSSGADFVLSTDVVKGPTSVKATSNYDVWHIPVPGEPSNYYYIRRSINVDFTKLVTSNNIVTIHFNIKTNYNPYLYLIDNNGKIARTLVYCEASDKWSTNDINISLADINQTSLQFTYYDLSSPSYTNKFNWNNVVQITIGHNDIPKNGQVYMMIDDIFISGNVIKGAKDSTSIKPISEGGLGYGCRTLTIKDSIAMTDTLDASDTSTPLARLALYELLRYRVVRTTGKIIIPLDLAIDWSTGKYIMQGQIVNIITDKWKAPDYPTGKLFRIVSVHYVFNRGGAIAELELNDDITSSIPVSGAVDPYTLITRITKPDFQDRSTGSLKISGGDFDCNIKPLIKDYPS